MLNAGKVNGRGAIFYRMVTSKSVEKASAVHGLCLN